MSAKTRPTRRANHKKAAQRSAVLYAETVRRWIRSDTPTRKAMREEIAEVLYQARITDPALACQLVELLGQASERPVWQRVARPNQLAPGTPGSPNKRTDWTVWAIIAGRAYGKTRTGSEWSAEKLKNDNWRHALVAANFADGRDDMVEGESGLIHRIPPSLLIDGSRERSWNRSIGELKLNNGSKARLYTSEKRDGLRGSNNHSAWGDEIAKWKDAHLPTTAESTWSMMMMGLRLGQRPQAVVTTTPKPVKLLTGTKEEPAKTGILDHPGTIVTSGTTHENLDNLAPTFRDIVKSWEGTRLGRQELLAEILTDVEGALWVATQLSRDQRSPGFEVGHAGGLLQVVVGVDPSVGAGEEGHDECGIIVAGTDAEKQGYVLADRTILASPLRWAHTAINAYHEFEADYIVAEVNNGGDLVRTLIHQIDRNIPYAAVSAARGKVTRAEPVAGLYEAGRIHHLGPFPKLEDQMTQWVPGEGKSPDRIDALVWAFFKLFNLGTKQGSTRIGQQNRPSSGHR